jgi:hypothetical protein
LCIGFDDNIIGDAFLVYAYLFDTSAQCVKIGMLRLVLVLSVVALESMMTMIEGCVSSGLRECLSTLILIPLLNAAF